MAPGVSSCPYIEPPQSISFSGSGFLVTYQLGVAQSFLNYSPAILRSAPCVLGASAGSLAAAAVVCEMNLITILDEILHFIKQMEAVTLGPLNPSINVFHWLESVLQKHVPSNAHQLASGRLAVAMTRLSDGEHIVVSEFQSKEDVVQALLCSCYVPGYCGFLPPSFKGVRYLDGGFSGMQPVFSNCTLTVSPFSGETDICPADTPSMWDMVVSGSTLKANVANSFRIINALYPRAFETLEKAFHSGYKDATDFLLSNDLTPYLLSNTVSQGPLSYNQIYAWSHQEAPIEKKEMKVEKETTTRTSFTDNRSMQMQGKSAEEEPARNQPVKGPFPHFDVVKNVLLENVMTCLNIFGLPARILSTLLLSLMLSYYAILQTRQRLEPWFKQLPEIVFWIWHSLRIFNHFFFNIYFRSLKRNTTNRLMPMILLWQWLKVQAKYEVPQKKMRTPPCDDLSFHSNDVRCGSLQKQLMSPSPDYKKTRAYQAEM